MTVDLPERSTNTTSGESGFHAGFMRAAHDLGQFDPPASLGQRSGRKESVTAVVSPADEHEDTLCRRPVRYDVTDGSTQEQFLGLVCDGVGGDVHEVLSGVGVEPPLLSGSDGLGGADNCHDDPSNPDGVLAAD